MKERIKAYYEYLLNTNPQFKQFDADTKGMSVEEVAAKYQIDLNNLDHDNIRIKTG